MSRGSRALTAAYLAAAGWLGWCAIHTYGHAAAWTITLHVAASVLFVIGVLRELDLRDARRQTATLIAQQVREEEARNGKPLTQLEAAMWVRLEAQFAEPDDPRSSAA